jgi:RNA polymerase sigma-70 factor, ECF subfamily
VTDETTEAADELRPLLFSIAYRMLGSVSEAEDAVQEALLRFHSTEEPIESPRAFLTTVVTRLSIDALRSARMRRETYVGAWLPEPLVTGDDEPAREAELADSLSQAFLVLLESLSPVERAVFLLREVFDYDYADIAGIVDKSEDNTRQLATRARRHVDERRPRFEADRQARQELAERFFAAARDGDLESLEKLLAADVVMYGDGGGKAPAAARPLHGPTQVMRLLVGLTKQATAWELEARPAWVNGQPGMLFLTPDGKLVSVLSMDIADGQVQALYSVVNPDKLRHLGLPLADVRQLLREVSARRKRAG